MAAQFTQTIGRTFTRRGPKIDTHKEITASRPPFLAAGEDNER